MQLRAPGDVDVPVWVRQDTAASNFQCLHTVANVFSVSLQLGILLVETVASISITVRPFLIPKWTELRAQRPEDHWPIGDPTYTWFYRRCPYVVPYPRVLEFLVRFSGRRTSQTLFSSWEFICTWNFLQSFYGYRRPKTSQATRHPPHGRSNPNAQPKPREVGWRFTSLWNPKYVCSNVA